MLKPLKDYKPALISNQEFIDILKKYGVKIDDLNKEIDIDVNPYKTIMENVMKDRKMVVAKNLDAFKDLKPEIMNLEDFYKVCKDSGLENGLNKDALSQAINNNQFIKMARLINDYKDLMPKNMKLDAFYKVCKECGIDYSADKNELIQRIIAHKDIVIAKNNLLRYSNYATQLIEPILLNSVKMTDLQNDKRDQIIKNGLDAQKNIMSNPTNNNIKSFGSFLNTTEANLTQAGLNALYKKKAELQKNESMAFSKFKKNQISKRMEKLNKMISFLQKRNGIALNYQTQLISNYDQRYIEKKNREMDRYIKQNKNNDIKLDPNVLNNTQIDENVLEDNNSMTL